MLIIIELHALAIERSSARRDYLRKRDLCDGLEGWERERPKYLYLKIYFFEGNPHAVAPDSVFVSDAAGNYHVDFGTIR